MCRYCSVLCWNDECEGYFVMDEPPCSCSAPGWCERFKLQQGTRAHALCQGTCCSAEQSQAYRRRWAREAGGVVAAPPPAAHAWRQRWNLATSCIHRGDKTGAQVGCGECGARHEVIPVLTCVVHGLCTERVSVERLLASCRRCQDRKPC